MSVEQGVAITGPGEPATRLLITMSALHYCADITDDNLVERHWPRLSSGEELLWQVLTAVNGHGDPPTDTALVMGLDDINLHYARVALDMAGVTA